MFNEELDYLVERVGGSGRIGPENLIAQGSQKLRQDIYMQCYKAMRDEGYRVVIWDRTMIVAGLRYFNRGQYIIIDVVYTRPAYRRKGFATALYKSLLLMPVKIMVPNMTSESGRLFFKSMGI